MGSSDESFAWTSASSASASEDSETVAVRKMKKQRRESSDSGDYCATMEHNPRSSNELKSPPLGRKAKTTIKEEFSDRDSPSLRDHAQEPRYVKSEPRCSMYEKKNEKKTKEKPLETGAHDSASHDESYLNLRVKLEETNSTTTPQVKAKKKKKRKSDNNLNLEYHNHDHISASEDSKSQIKKRRRNTELVDSTDECNGTHTKQMKQEPDESGEILHNKKRKASKRRDSYSDDVTDANLQDMIIEDKFSAEETIVENRKQLRVGSHENTVRKSSVNKNEGTLSGDTKDRSKAIIKDSYSSKEFVSEDSSSDDNMTSLKENPSKKTSKKYEHHPDNHPNINSNNDDRSVTNNHSVTDSSKGMGKIADRIMFEDDFVAEINVPLNKYSKQSLRTEQFLKANSDLKSLEPELDSGSAITEDDGVWLLHCPREVDIRLLKHADLLLDSKCKFKVDGHTYSGSIDTDDDAIIIQTLDDNSFLIKNLQLCGSIRFRKRIPKAHYIEDNVMMNNQTDFIPLPDTKYRHPLFGPKYKRATKIPASVKARLRAVNSEQSDSSRRHQKAEARRAGLGGKRARSPTPDAGPARKKTKRSKHNIGSPEAWDCKEAIEENLFNY